MSIIPNPSDREIYNSDVHLCVGKPGWQAVAKGGRGVGGEMSRALPLHKDLFSSGFSTKIFWAQNLNGESGGDGSRPCRGERDRLRMGARCVGQPRSVSVAGFNYF